MATALARTGLLAARRLAAAPPGGFPIIGAAAALEGIGGAPLRRRGDASAAASATSSSPSIRPFSGISFGAITRSAPSAFAAGLGAAAAAPLSPTLASRIGAARGFGSKNIDEPDLSQAEIAALEAAFENDDDGEELSSVEDLLSDDGGPLPSSRRKLPSLDEDLSKMTNEELEDTSTIPGWDLVHCPPRKFPRGALVGTVVSDRMQKTVNVAVDRYRIVPRIRKRRRYTKKFMAHDEEEVCGMGDVVMIVPCQRISKRKHFMVREIIRARGTL